MESGLLKLSGVFFLKGDFPPFLCVLSHNFSMFKVGEKFPPHDWSRIEQMKERRVQFARNKWNILMGPLVGV